MPVHKNSIKSYGSIPLTLRQSEVVDVLKTLNVATDQLIADKLGYTINRVTGRITELRDKGVLREISSIMGSMGKYVRVTQLNPLKRQGELFE